MKPEMFIARIEREHPFDKSNLQVPCKFSGVSISIWSKNKMCIEQIYIYTHYIILLMEEIMHQLI